MSGVVGEARVGRFLFVTRAGRDFSMFICGREGASREGKFPKPVRGLINTTKACEETRRSSQSSWRTLISHNESRVPRVKS